MLANVHTHFSMQGSVPSVKYRVNDSAIQCSSMHKVTQQILWSTHINRVCSRAYHSLHVIKRNIPQNSILALRKNLYLTLVRSRLCYDSQLCRPHLFKDINNLERVQRRATMLILQDFSDYKSRLISLNLLLVSMWLEQQDVLFMVKCLQSPSDNFDILNSVSFSKSNSRPSSKMSLKYNYKRTNLGRHYYFNRIVRLWNTFPALDLQQSAGIITLQLSSFLWNHFIDHFNPDIPCTLHLRCPCSNCHLSCN